MDNSALRFTDAPVCAPAIPDDKGILTSAMLKPLMRAFVRNAAQKRD
jgi:hypothetical protein